MPAMSEAVCWALIPAAGTGSRMDADRPKPYLTINDKTIIEHALRPFCEHEAICGIVVVTAAADAYWPHLALAGHEKISRADGGQQRCHSVLNGLLALERQADKDDWVLVHDAARPCITPADIDRLIDTLTGHPVGGALGVPVTDTMKRTNAEREVIETVAREQLWHAMTPQMFRLGRLKAALQQAMDDNVIVTDEMQAMERLGMRPKLIACGRHNIKVTHAEDVALAAFYLRGKDSSPCV